MLEQMKSTADSIQTDGENAHETESGEDTSSGSASSRNRDGAARFGRNRAGGRHGVDRLRPTVRVAENKRRRRVLQYLLDVDDEITLDVLAERIAAEENGKDIKQISSQERKRVYVGLYQCHLPKMDDWGPSRTTSPAAKSVPQRIRNCSGTICRTKPIPMNAGGAGIVRDCPWHWPFCS